MNYHESLQPFEDRVKQGLIYKVEKAPLVLYKYSDLCTYSKAWDDYTRQARGIIFDIESGECVSRNFSKFFNLNENESEIQALQKRLDAGLNYTVYDKADGSCTLLHWKERVPQMTTMGSFDSDQARIALTIFNEKYYTKNFFKISTFPKEYTAIFEVIYPANKIVVDYGDEWDLILLGAVHRLTGVEYPPEALHVLADIIGCRMVRSESLTLEQCIERAKTINKNKEGWVVRFSDGYRIKIKGEQYLKVHRALSNCTPLFVWEEMKNGYVPDSYKSLIPEEVLPEVQKISLKLEEQYAKILYEIARDMMKFIPKEALENKDYKTIGLIVQDKEKEMKHPKAIFPWIRTQVGLDKYIHDAIRPVGNRFIENV
jgi:RNA ligase